MTDLVEFLRAALDEDERVILDHWDNDGRARVATMWTGGEPGYTTVASDHADGVWVADGREVTDARRVLVLFDPARVLAEVAAKRAIVDLHESWPVLAETEPEFSTSGDVDNMTFQVSKRMAWLTEQEYRARFGDEPPTSPIIRALAQPYAGRPGWREEWAT